MKKKQMKPDSRGLVGGAAADLGDCVSQAWFDESETKTQNRGL
jgi:hypothetical protein